MNNSGSSIPAGTSVYRFLPVKNSLDGSNIYYGVVATVVHERKAFRDFQNDGTPRSFLVNLKTHVNVSLNPNLKQQLSQHPYGRSYPALLNPYAERMQLGYVYDGNVVKRAPGAAFAPQTQQVEVSDTTSSETRVTVSEGASLSFGVNDTVVVSVTDWLVALAPVEGSVLWDYYIHSPYDVNAGQKPRFSGVEKFPNISLVGFSFDTSAWFEIFDLNRTSVEFQPAFKLRVSILGINLNQEEFYLTQFLGDADVMKPTVQPKLTVDLSKVPNRPPKPFSA